MARAHPPLYSFNQGEVSKLALARVDVARLRLAASCQLNWMPWALGPMMLRPGLIQVGEINADAPARLLRFIFSKLDVALLELTASIMRVWVGEQLVSRVAVATQVVNGQFNSNTGWDNSDSTAQCTASFNDGGELLAYSLGGLARIRQAIPVAGGDRGKEHALRFVVTKGPVTVRAGSTGHASDYIAQTNLDTGTHSLAFTPTGSIFLEIESTDYAVLKVLSSVTIESAGVLTLPTPWGTSDLPNVRYDQSGDIAYVACYGIQQHKIERRGTTSWSVVKYRSANGPFESVPAITANFTPATTHTDTTLSSDRPYFQPGHVDALFRLFTAGQANDTYLGAPNYYSPPVEVSGVGDSRNYTWAVNGTWGGILSFQRSFNGPDSGFSTISTTDVNGNISSNTGGTGGTPDLDNIVCWERVGFEAGNFENGVAEVTSDYDGGGGYAIVRVTSYVSPQEVGIEILQQFSSGLATTDWVEADWSGVGTWPSSVAFFDGRLFWFGNDSFWGSQSDDYVGFADIDSRGNPLGDAGAINEQFGSGPVDTVAWGLGLTRLLAGREGVITSIRSSAFDEVLTPTNVSAKDCSTQGAARLPAVKIDMDGIYVQQSGRRAYRLSFSPQLLDYVGHDLTRLNLDIGKPGFVDVDVQRQPDTNVYLPRSDGQVAVLLDDPQDELECWWRIQTAGVVEAVAVLPDPGIEDLVYFVVRRIINGVTRRFLERLAHRDSATGGPLNVQADCCLSYTGTPVASVQLAWLPSTQVVVWADGHALGTVTTDAAGNCAMPDNQAHSNIVVGLGGQTVIGSTAAKLPNSNAPDQVFGELSSTLTVPSSYEGCPAEVFADIAGNGKMIHVGAVTVKNATVTLPNNQAASVIVACLGYVAPFMSAKLAYAAQLGSALTQKKKIDHLGLVLFDSAPDGLLVGDRFDALDPLPLIENDEAVPAGTVWPEYDEPAQEVPGEWNTDARLCLLAQAPNPCTIGAVVVELDTQEKG